MTMMELKKIEPMSAGKVYAGICAVFGLIYAAIVILAGLLFGTALGMGGLLSAIGVSIIMLVIFTVMGFVMGALGAVIYNVVAKKFAGVLVEFADVKKR